VTDTEQRQAARTTWSAGDYDSVATHIWSAGADIIERVGVSEGHAVLDVACGTGNATIPAAQTGASVTGLDITPELFEDLRRRADEAGVEVTLVEGDAEELPFADESFDVVVSTFGCMFAPDHRRTAAEIARVLKPGGRVGIAAWTLAGTIGDFFRSIASLAPPPPEGFQPPPLWGDSDHVTGLFEGTDMAVGFEDGAVQFEFPDIDAAINEYYEKFGPIVMLRAALEPEGRGDEIREALRGVFTRAGGSDEGPISYPGEYLVSLGDKG
jgi:SAM-dependent methyltransferase